EAARIAVDFPPFEVWSPGGWVLALALKAVHLAGDSAILLHRMLWIFHGALVIAFFVLLPVTVLGHIFTGAYSVARPAGRRGLLHSPGEPIVAAVDLPQFRRIDLLQADACLTCGRCTQVCPAQAAGKPLSPRAVVLGLREHLDHPEEALTRQV